MIQAVRLVFEAQFAAAPVDGGVQCQQHRIGPVAQLRQPGHVDRDAVEFVAVDHEQSPAVGGLVQELVGDFDVAGERGLQLVHVVAQELVVVAGHVADDRAALDHAKDAADQERVRVVPMKAAVHFPAVDDVADQVEIVACVLLEEREQAGRPGCAGSRGARRR